MAAAADIDATFQALADPTRRRVVELLRERPRLAGELSRRIRVSPPSMSRHLRVLKQSGLVSETPSPDDARARIYQLQPAPFDELQSWLAEVERFWTDQLGAFKAHAEAHPAARSGRSRGGRKKSRKP